MTTELLSNYDHEACNFGWIHTDRISSAPTASFPDPNARRTTSIDLSMTGPSEFFARGLEFKNNQEYEKALNAFNAAVQLLWAFPDAHLEIGNCASILKDYDRALTAYASAIEIDAQCSIGYYNIALTYLDMANHEQALAWLTATIKVDPEYRLAYLQMAQHFADQRQDRIAIHWLIKAAYIELPRRRRDSNLYRYSRTAERGQGHDRI